MAITIESSIKQLDAVTDAAKEMATRLGDVNSAIANVSQNFQKSDNSLQGFVEKVSSINELSKAFSGVYTAVTEQNNAMKSDALEWVFEKTEQVTTGVKSMKSAYDTVMDVYTQLNPLYQTAVSFLNNNKDMVENLARNVSKHNIALEINKVKTYLCAAAQSVATIATKLWNKVTDQSVKNALIRLPAALGAASLGFILYTGFVIPATIATYAFSVAIKAVSKAIHSIPIVGWILAIIGAIISFIGLIIKGFQWLWDNSMQFREVLFGIWEVIKSIFSGLWEVIVGIATGIADFFVGIWEGLSGFIASAWEGISGFFTELWTSIIGVLSAVWQTISGVFINIWNKLVGTFGTMKDWISKNLVQPLKDAFSGLWNFICNLVNKVINKLDGMLAPIRALWNKLFGKTKGAWETGKEKGRESYLKDQKEKELAEKGQSDTSDKNNEKPPKKETDILGISGLGGTSGTQNIGNGGGAVNDKIGSVGSDSGKASNTYITLGSLVESLTIQSASISEGMDDMREMVVRTLLEVLNGQNMAGAKY